MFRDAGETDCSSHFEDSLHELHKKVRDISFEQEKLLDEFAESRCGSSNEHRHKLSVNQTLGAETATQKSSRHTDQESSVSSRYSFLILVGNFNIPLNQGQN